MMRSTYNYIMNGQQKWIKILLVGSLFLFFSASSAYLHYINCVETDFPPSQPRLEIPDQDYLLADQQNRLEILRPSPLTAFVETAFSGKFLLFSFKSSLYDQKNLILRC